MWSHQCSHSLKPSQSKKKEDFIAKKMSSPIQTSKYEEKKKKILTEKKTLHFTFLSSILQNGSVIPTPGFLG